MNRLLLESQTEKEYRRNFIGSSSRIEQINNNLVARITHMRIKCFISFVPDKYGIMERGSTSIAAMGELYLNSPHYVNDSGLLAVACRSIINLMKLEDH